MSEVIIRHTEEEMIASLAAFLPGGELFESAFIPGTNLHSLLAGLSGELLRAENFLFLYNSQFLPDQTTVFIEEWESALGIPDDCFPGPAEASTETRRLHILVKLASLGVQTSDDFENLATILGFPDVEVVSGVGSDAESIVNGDFATDTIWTKGTGWTISSGTANKAAGVASDLSQDITAVTGKLYVVKYDVSGRTAGSITPDVAGTNGVARSTNGSFEELITGGAVDTFFRLEADSTFDGSIDNVSVRGSIAPPDGRFTIVVKFTTSENQFPLVFPYPFGDEQFAILECLFGKLKPANCDIIFELV